MRWKMLEELVDICLLAQMRTLILNLSEEKDASVRFHGILRKSLLWERLNVETMESVYGFRYPGEVLERYAEKIGDSIRVVRALALALAEMKPLLTKSMFVGKQYELFLRTVRKSAKGDLICMGALFLLEDQAEKRAALRKILWSYEWKDIMEVLYLLFLFEDEGWEKWRDPLIFMLGTGRTIEVYGNQGLYVWVINHFAQNVEGYRKKDMNLLKAICRLPLCNAEGKNPVKKWMMENGYSEDEICFLNLSVLSGATLPKRLMFPSLTLEKMALNACLRFLGSEKEYPQEIYVLCAELLQQYSTYEIKLEGETGIFCSLRRRDFSVRSVGAYLTLFSYKGCSKVPDSYFAIDLLDKKWDVLQKKLEPEQYTENVVQALTEKEYSPEELAICVRRYKEVTGEELIQYLWTESKYSCKELFLTMARHKLLDAHKLGQQYIEDYQKLSEKEWKEKWQHMRENMHPFLFTLNNQESYGIFSRIVLEFGVGKIGDILQKRNAVEDIFGLDTYNWTSRKLHIIRECFSDAQNRQLFQWAEQYVYLKHPAHYGDFLYAVLVSPKEAAGIEPGEAAKAARYFLEHGGYQGTKAQELRTKYWTQEELKEYEDKLKKEREALRRKEKLKIAGEEKENFQTFLKESAPGSISKLSDYLQHKYGERERAAQELIASYLKDYCGQQKIRTTEKESVNIMGIVMNLYKEQALSLEELKKCINEMEVVIDE